jgi:hypothetical protein
MQGRTHVRSCSTPPTEAGRGRCGVWVPCLGGELGLTEVSPQSTPRKRIRGGEAQAGPSNKSGCESEPARRIASRSITVVADTLPPECSSQGAEPNSAHVRDREEVARGVLDEATDRRPGTNMSDEETVMPQYLGEYTDSLLCTRPEVHVRMTRPRHQRVLGESLCSICYSCNAHPLARQLACIVQVVLDACRRHERSVRRGVTCSLSTREFETITCQPDAVMASSAMRCLRT